MLKLPMVRILMNPMSVAGSATAEKDANWRREPRLGAKPTLSGSKRRSKPEIMFTLLMLMSERPMSLVELSVEARINFSAAKQALGFLISKGLVSWIIIDGRVCYMATGRGKEFVTSFKATSRYLE